MLRLGYRTARVVRVMPFTVMGLPTCGTSQGILGMHLATMQCARSMPSILGFSQMRTSVSPSLPSCHLSDEAADRRVRRHFVGPAVGVFGNQLSDG